MVKKPETREKRLPEIRAMMTRGEKFHRDNQKSRDGTKHWTRKFRMADAKEVGVGNPAEETCRHSEALI